MAAGTLRLLSVEDATGGALALEAALSRIDGDRYELTRVDCVAAGVAALAAGDFDAILIDASLPDVHGLEGIERVLVAAPRTPLVVLTGQAEEALGRLSVHAGAQDFLVKGSFDGARLQQTLDSAMERGRLTASHFAASQRQLDSKDEMLSHVSHELRTPLSAIYQFTTILLDGLGGKLTDDQRDYLGVVLRNATQLRRMIDDLLEACRAVSGPLAVDPCRARLPPLLERTAGQYEAVALQRRIAIQVEDEGADSDVLADPQRVRQIVSNMLDNALKFVPDGGAITLSSRRDPDEPGWMRISVRDSGCGVPKDCRLLVFDRLYQVEGSAGQGSRKGLGLGLYICRELVLRHGGRIWAENHPEGGAVFNFTLPEFSLARLAAPLIETGPVTHLLRVALRAQAHPHPQAQAQATAGAIADATAGEAADASAVTSDAGPNEAMWTAALDAVREGLHLELDRLVPVSAEAGPEQHVYVITSRSGDEVAALAERLGDLIRLKAELDATPVAALIDVIPLSAADEAAAGDRAGAVARQLAFHMLEGGEAP